MVTGGLITGSATTSVPPRVNGNRLSILHGLFPKEAESGFLSTLILPVVSLRAEESLKMPAQCGPTQLVPIYLALGLDYGTVQVFVERQRTYSIFDCLHYQV